MEPEKIIGDMFGRGVLLSKEMVDQGVEDTLKAKIEAEGDLLVLTPDYTPIIAQQGHIVDWYEIDKYRVDAERDRNDDLYQRHLQKLQHSQLFVQPSTQPQDVHSLETQLEAATQSASFSTEAQIQPQPALLSSALLQTALLELAPLQVLVSYVNVPHKYEVKDFSNYFVSRYRFLESLLRYRQELQNLTAINRILQKKEAEPVSIIGIISDIRETKSGNLIVTIEDLTGQIKIIFSKNNTELFRQAKDLVPDEVIGITGQSADKAIFANSIVWPDIPQAEPRTAEKEEYAIFLSDLHVGSLLFLKEEFNRFLHWINGQAGNDAQREMAQKVRYIFIAGDLVDGVGIYPSQDEELEIKDITGQYNEFCRLIKQIPVDKQIIICPGNHDVVHLAEPQPVFYKEYTPLLFELPNVTLVTNPALVNIAKTPASPGLDVLMYHGYSFDYFVANVESIRNGGGYHRSDLIMKFLLKRRHLAPTFRSTPYFPAHAEDPLVIRKVPDILITGHIHYCTVANYRGVTMMSGSCWQAKTAFQEKLGHDPEPARVPLINLKTREIKVLKFL
ncbi:DNA-directed DNA polymerase II small subunit [Candidatus Woesearchaeota archaeon]|nr:DNA-directed DNA polymerase II small subunit [Candidatus Woesearchaeota archaeon]